MCTANSTAINNWTFGIGTAGQLIGGMMGAKANAGYHEANASYLESMNALNQIQANQAIDSVQHGAGLQSSAVRNKGISLTKTQKASMASHGLSQSATYQNILDDTITRSERDAMAILYNADIQAKNIRTNAALQQAQYLSQAAQERAAGSIAYRTGLLSTVGQFADSWSKWSQTGMANYGNKGKWTGLPVYTSANGKKVTYNGSLDWGQGKSSIPVSMPNTNYYSGVNSLDWSAKRFSAVRAASGGAGWRGSGSLWGGAF